MNFEFATQINPFLEKLNFTKALEIAESALTSIPKTEFHSVIGHSLTDQADELANWIDDFYKKASTKIEIKSLYFEMNEFDINTETWYIDCFAFRQDGGLNLGDMEWLCDFEVDSHTETNTIFAIEGYEKLQNAFESIELKNDTLQDSRDWCEQIIITRYMELMRTAHIKAKEKNLSWAKTPIYFTEHAYDFVVKSEN